MPYNYITKDGSIFDQKINEGLMTATLGVPSVQLVNGGKSFILTTISTGGLHDYKREKHGFQSSSVQNDKEVYTMGQDRGVEFFIDTQDVDETNQELAVANISKVFIEEHVQPELDAYRFSTLGKKAVEAGQTVDETLTVDNVYSRLKAAILPLRKYGAQNLVGFVSSEVMDALERSKEFTRSITNQNVGLTALESRVTSIDGVQLIEVWDSSRFQSDYTFDDGYAPTADAKPINFLFVNKPSVISIVKENAIYMFAPGEHTQGDGYIYQNRLYHDIFVKKQLADGVSVSYKAAASK